MEDEKRINHLYCCRVLFNGVSLYQVTRTSSIVEICYCYDKAFISINFADYDDVADFEKEFKIAEKFLKGHIEWAQKSYWGKKYSRKKKVA